MSRTHALSVVSSSLSSRLVAGAVLGGLSAFGLGGGGGVSGGAGFCADTGPNGPPGAEFCLPTEPEAWRFVDSAHPEAPAPLRALAERTEVAWSAVWDPVLEVPYLAFPRGICRLGALESSSTSDAVASAAAAFLERHRDVFGVGPEGLTDLEVYPFDDGHHLTAAQRHAGLPVRGTVFRLRVNGDGTIRSVGTTVARELPPMETVEVSPLDLKAWADRAKDRDGLISVLAVRPQILFPAGLSSAVAGVVVGGLDAEGRELEVFRTIADGEPLWVRETAVGFEDEIGSGATCDQDLVVSIAADGYCPDPEEPYRIPADRDGNAPYPLPRLRFQVEQWGECPATYTWYTSKKGKISLEIHEALEPKPYTLTVEFSEPRFFLNSELEDYKKKELTREGSLEWRKTYNTALVEFEALHLFVYHHLHKCFQKSAEVVSTHNLYNVWRSKDRTNSVRFAQDDYAHEYQFLSGRWSFANDELTEMDRENRWRKITPTIIYHEFGHEFVLRLASATGEPLVVQGVADAFATYLAQASLLGHDKDLNPVADEAARDLRKDEDPYPSSSPRHGVAGALWELWEGTRGSPIPKQETPAVESESPFAWGLLARWLASRRSPPGQEHGRATLVWHPALGLELYLEADVDGLGGDGDLANGVPNEIFILRAFGRRNLFPRAFLRGDANGDGTANISDAVRILGYLFLGESEVGCPDALDANDDGAIDLTDPIRLLGHLFLGQPPLPDPFESCGPDPTPHDNMGCWESPCPPLSL